MELGELFMGTWILDASYSQYEMGEPPQTGEYKIERQGERLLFIVHWRDHLGQPFDLRYGGIADGQTHPFENPNLASEMRLGFDGERILESWSYKDGQELGYAKRELIGSGDIMIVTQEAPMADGRRIKNKSRYRRQKV
ncbi:MAG: hypothetical protein A2508_02175 [Candidatus Lambdaproteobacteria bacterium RIFOXYD12_FULL_49_8]|uniref:Lipocalin-like domain-containing protein n=1 Tax=Candidatus Lambdaproteobacteria bacterium RIFOXYD2_FULL_50_16 TaxID=1817772 RepID=A0A1F6GEK9_9PROT|nr:MAG: hypothetical protein A2527_01215 [Candidatus Lambdaproteobacteria bacterium RIFOXYD2_FULL_50_16]OGG97813.1 MAG: hypothetical protein A2508_02175 [Candidatus Lambdaproteobacteria bacterium RIFOXYD12_FULL_49_8]